MTRFLFCLLLGLCTNSLYAQYRPDSTQFAIETKDGNIYMGVMIGQENDKILFQTKNLGIIQISKSDIRKMETVNPSQVVKGQVWAHNFQTSRYFNLPNGYGLRKGEAYYKNSWIFFNHASVGLSDRFSIGGGFIPTFLFGSGNVPVWINPKLSIPVVENKVNLGVAGLIGGVTGTGEVVSIVHGNATLGTRDKNISLGVGYGYADGEWTTTPLVTLSAMVRTGPKGYVVTENYYAEGTALLFVGGRRLITKVSLDYGLIIPAGMADTFVGIPWLSVIIPIKKTS